MPVIGLPRLGFDAPEIEDEWTAYADDRARRPLQVGLTAFGILIVLAGLGDPWQGYAGWETVLGVRLLVWGPLFLIGARLLSVQALRFRALDLALAVTVVATLSLIALMWSVMPSSTAIGFPMYWTVLLLLVHAVAPLGLVRATGAGVVVIAGYLLTMLRHEAPSAHFAAHTVFILVAWSLLIAGSWILERHSRAAFLVDRELRARTHALDGLTRLQASVLDTLSEGVCGIDAAGTVTFANPAAGVLLDRPISAILGARFHEEFHDSDNEGPCPLCVGRVPVRDLGARLRLPAGRRDVECSAEPASCPDGVRVVSFRDVGRRLEIAEQLRHTQKMDAIGLFVGGVAHEFNNLLTPILGGVELARRELGPGHGLNGSLGDIQRAGNRAAALVRQFLALGSRADLAPRAVDLTATVEESLTLVRSTFDPRIKITFDGEGGAWVLADPNQVQQVLLNLCTNAQEALQPTLEAGRPARIHLIVRRVACDDEVAGVAPGSQGGTWIGLEVTDSGPGIPAGVLHRVFEPFFTTRASRTGLGLAVVHGIIRQHGGWVSIEPNPGGGVRVRCAFPAAAQPLPRGEHPPLPTSPRTRAVLLVDDEEMVRTVTRRLLERVGHVVEDDASGIAALARLRGGYRPDVIVLDILMPELDGWAVLAQVRSLDPSIPVVMLSGYDLDPPGTHPVAPDAQLTKPYRLDDLRSALEVAVAVRRDAQLPV